MSETCPQCNNDGTVNLTDDVKLNKDFKMYFRAYIYCSKCEKYIFVGKES